MGPPSKSEIRATYDRIAPSFAASRKDPWPQVLEFVTSLPPGARVLDVGCGNGRHLRALIDSGRRAVGVDFSRPLLRIGRETLSSSRPAARPALVEADATSLPLADGSVDACLCIAVLHHLPTSEDRLRTLREIRRVLARGGRLLVSVWAADQPRFRRALESRRGLPPAERNDVEVPWSLPDGTTLPRYYHLFEGGELETLIIECGLHGETFFSESGNIFGRASNDDRPGHDG